MPFSTCHFRRQPWPVMDGRVWVMVVLLLGMLVSSLGHASSHGIAAVVAAQHGGDAAHVHSYDDAPDAHSPAGEAGHPHHNSADHSHDKAHALPFMPGIHLPVVPVWRPLAHPLDAGWLGFRLDRPPMV